MHTSTHIQGVKKTIFYLMVKPHDIFIHLHSKFAENGIKVFQNHRKSTRLQREIGTYVFCLVHLTICAKGMNHTSYCLVCCYYKYKLSDLRFLLAGQ